MVALRIRSIVWFATGVVLALFATVLVTQAWQADAAAGDTDSTFVPVAPCRLFDTRPGKPPAGGKKAPLAAGGSNIYTQQVTGDIGDCVGIPAGATAISMNVTIVNPTAQSNLRIFPADEALPTVSNLNWLPGQSPTPNKVDVKLSPTGQIKMFNQVGTVDVLADVVGYYTNSTLKELAAGLSALGASVRYAKVDADAGGANLINGHGVTSVSREGAGVFTVTFASPITKCGWVATLNDNDAGSAAAGEISVERWTPGDPDSLLIRTFDSSGAHVDPLDTDGFSVQVVC
jgi:hypothetical protein